MTTGTVIHLADANDFQRTVLDADRPVLVDFWAQWCQPCHLLAPTIDALAETYGDRVVVAKADIDVARTIAERYDIRSIPSVVIFRGGREVERLVGVRPIGDYAAALDRVLA